MIVLLNYEFIPLLLHGNFNVMYSNQMGVCSESKRCSIFKNYISAMLISVLCALFLQRISSSCIPAPTQVLEDTAV